MKLTFYHLSFSLSNVLDWTKTSGSEIYSASANVPLIDPMYTSVFAQCFGTCCYVTMSEYGVGQG